MKKYMHSLIAAAVAVFATGTTSLAQSSATSQPVTVNIDLSASVISIALGATPTVNFVYASAADYTAPKTVSKPGHFTVVSNRNYTITAAAQTPFTVVATDPTPLSLGVVNISVDPATLNGGTPATQALSQTPAPIITNAVPTVGAVYNINYAIPDATPLLGRSASIYSTTVVYTATQL
ncbi:hypothetical protein [Pedobacter sp. SYP-B3415]|uniref:hypothetical protein n=1 Tax=Pedobacter sp. SYP-B3415 TaxID=2496641 RepID=UPI00101CACFC|nr:hypothetical protein [Pedobacter sp. SYP-B3415]